MGKQGLLQTACVSAHARPGVFVSVRPEGYWIVIHYDPTQPMSAISPELLTRLPCWPQPRNSRRSIECQHHLAQTHAAMTPLQPMQAGKATCSRAPQRCWTLAPTETGSSLIPLSLWAATRHEAATQQVAGDSWDTTRLHSLLNSNEASATAPNPALARLVVPVPNPAREAPKTHTTQVA